MIYNLALLTAGIAEVLQIFCFSLLNKANTHKSKAIYLLLTLACFAIELFLLGYAMIAIQMSIAYAIWTGIGTLGAVAIDLFYNKAKLELKQYLGIVLVISSVVLLRIV